MDTFKTPEIVTISQSLIKAFFNKSVLVEHCPRKIFTKYFLKQEVQETTIKQLRGIYFERHVLGGGDLFSLPGHKTTGKDLLPTVRINEQIKRFKDVVVDNVMMVHPNINTQIPLIKRYNERYLLKGVLDWFPTFVLYEGDIRLSIVDLKLTEDLTSDFGPFAWGNYENMNWLQGALYHHLVHDIDWELNKHLSPLQKRFIQRFENILNREEELFLYLVFDYTEELRHKFYESVWDYDKFKYVENQVEGTIHQIELNNLSEWQPNPCSECKNCLINCPVRAKIEKQ